MIIQIDTREKDRAVKSIISEFDGRNIKHISSKLYVGDYMNLDNSKLIIDRKQNLYEMCVSVCQNNKRFIQEIKRAREVGIRLIFLIEHGYNIKKLDDVLSWENYRIRTSPMALSGQRLYKILSCIREKYDIDYIFCDKNETGGKIVDLLK